ncbi:MAG: acyltransferase [Bacteroidia bacterium]|nr:acyltransferase [Bacteroidia bacterium]
MNNNQASKKLDVILIVRGILAVSVVFWHVIGYKGEIIHFFNIPGRTAVWIFFGISGYVMANGFLKKKYLFTLQDLKKFYINRFFRIYPLFLLVSMISFLTVYLTTDKVLINHTNILQQLFMLQFNHAYLLCGVFWALGIEVQFYIIAPLISYFLMNITKHKNIIWIVAYLIMLAWSPASHFFFGWSFDGRNLTNNLSHFFIGMLFCAYVTDRKIIQIDSRLLITVILILLLSTNWLYQVGSRCYWTAGQFLIDLIIALLILLHSGLESKKIKDKIGLLSFATMIGTISYGIYAWHGILIVNSKLLTENVFIAIIVSVCVAYFSFLLFERPILNIRKQYIMRIKS